MSGWYTDICIQACVLNNKQEARFECYRSDVNTGKRKRVVKSADTWTHSIVPNYCSIYII